jgi:lactoylglutathione lyase
MAHEIPSGRALDADFMFTKLRVHDLDRAAAFYTSVFGLVEMHRVEAQIADRAVSEVIYMPTYAGGPMFILAKFQDEATPARDELILGFAVKDLDALLERAEKAGGRLVEDKPAGPTSPFRTAFIEDGEGHLLQISQAPA